MLGVIDASKLVFYVYVDIIVALLFRRSYFSFPVSSIAFSKPVNTRRNFSDSINTIPKIQDLCVFGGIDQEPTVIDATFKPLVIQAFHSIRDFILSET